MKQDNPNYLTTHEEWSLASQLEMIDSDSLPACLIRVSPKNSKTGLNEERGVWILEFWKKATNNKKIDGHRIGWSDIVFFTQSLSEKEFQNQLLNIQKLQIEPNLESLAVFTHLNGNIEDKIKEVDRMYLQLTKIGKWEENIYSEYYLDGIKKKPKQT